MHKSAIYYKTFIVFTLQMQKVYSLKISDKLAKLVETILIDGEKNYWILLFDQMLEE